MARATAQETADRVELLAGMILAGSNNTVCLAHARHTWGGLQSAGLQAREARLGADQGRHRRERHRPAGAAVVVNPDADGRGWTGDAAEEPWRCGGMHPPARSHDWHWVQLPPRPWSTPLICVIETS